MNRADIHKWIERRLRTNGGQINQACAAVVARLTARPDDLLALWNAEGQRIVAMLWSETNRPAGVAPEPNAPWMGRMQALANSGGYKAFEKLTRGDWQMIARYETQQAEASQRRARTAVRIARLLRDGENMGQAMRRSKAIRDAAAAWLQVESVEAAA